MISSPRWLPDVVRSMLDVGHSTFAVGRSLLHVGRSPRPSPSSCAGFTLVEIALTAMIIGLGILSTMSLARHGADTALRAASESRATLFADSTFATLQAINDELRFSDQTNAWSDFWTSFSAGETNLSSVCPDFWSDATNLLYLAGDGSMHTNRFLSAAPCRSPGTAPLRIPEQTIHYRLMLEIDDVGLYTKVNLHVWPSGADVGDKAISFYTHFIGEEPLR